MDVTVNLNCINAVHNGNTFTVTGNTVNIDVDYSLGPICLPAITSPVFSVNLGMLPPGSYTVTANAILNGTNVSSLSNVSLVVNSCCSASPNFSSTSPSDTICLGDSVNFMSTGTGLTSQKWFENNVFVSSTTSYGKRFNNPGTFDIKLVATDTSCTDSITRTILVETPPTVDLGQDTSICQGDHLILYADTMNDSAVWFDGSTLDSIIIFTSGPYYLTSYRNGCMNSDSINIGLLSPPSVDLGPDTILCVGDSLILDVFLQGATYLWHDQSTSSSLIARDSGSYSVLVTDSNGCSSSSVIHIAIDTTCFVSLIESSLLGNIAIYPNPVQDNFVLHLNSGGKELITLEIYDTTGKLISKARTSVEGDSKVHISTLDWQKGLYFLKVQLGDQHWTENIVKE